MTLYSEPYSDKEFPYLEYKRWETDEEMAKRIEDHNNWEARNEAEDRRRYEALKKRFER